VPLVLGLVVRRTPPWSAWSTVLVGFCGSLFISDYLTPEWVARTFGGPTVLDATSREYWKQGIELFGNITVASAWFLGTALFWQRTPPEQKAEVAEFFSRFDRPVDFEREEGRGNDAQQCAAVSRLCLAYGGFVVLLALIPNSPAGRLAFVACGMVAVVVGFMLRAAGRKAAG
jgi:SSS family solute:Na+ symporter